MRVFCVAVAVFAVTSGEAAAISQSSISTMPAEAATRAAERAEQAANEAEKAANEARTAADRAKALAVEARRAITVARGASAPVILAEDYTPPLPPIKEAKLEPPLPHPKNAPDGCPTDADIRTPEYAVVAGQCERYVLKEVDLPRAASRDVTGVGTAFAVAGNGSAATLTVENVSAWRGIRFDHDQRSFASHWFGRNASDPRYNLQRYSRRVSTIGLRANLTKDTNGLATIATFGKRDQLTSGLALKGSYGHQYSRSEKIYPFGSDAPQPDSYPARALKNAKQLTEDCRKDKGTAADCQGMDLIRWIFAVKDRALRNPGAVKLYNDVFWAPPPFDPEPRFGWKVSGEIARPKISYFPFALTQTIDPFNPSEQRTVIDPALFPTDFAAHITQNEPHLNLKLGATGFFHLSKGRAGNMWGSERRGWNGGTTFIASASYLREDAIEKPFLDVKICPPAAAGQAFVTDQRCTSVNIARPVRTEGVVLGGAIRQRFEPLWFLPAMMIAPVLTYNTDNDGAGLVLPLYFADKSGVFSGGLRFGHQWGGRNADGTRKKAESLFGLVFGASLTLNGIDDD